MFIKKILLVMIVGLTLSFLTAANAQEKNKKADTKSQQTELQEKKEAKPWNEVCPVRGGKVQKETALVEYNDKYYGFCCPGCDSKFEKEPEKYSKNLSEDGKKFIGKK